MSSTLKLMFQCAFMAMVPVIELRGALPWGITQGLPVPLAYGLCVVCNMIPVPFILLFIRKIFAWLRQRHERLNGLVCRLEARAESKKDIVRRYAFWGLVILVAIPLPGTGAWTGALVASLLDIRMRVALPAILLGILIAGAITLAVSCGVMHLWF